MGRHAISEIRAKQELSEQASQKRKITGPFEGGGYYITLTAQEPYYRVMSVFVWASDRANAIRKASEFPQLAEFVETMSDIDIAVNGAGPQVTSREEGVFRDLSEKEPWRKSYANS